MSKKHTKSERQLFVQHILALAGRDLSSNEIISCLGDVYKGIAGESKLKGDLLSLRNNVASNVTMIEKDGHFTYEYVGTIEYLDPITDNNVINMDNVELLKSGKSPNAESPKKDKSSDKKPEKEEKAKVAEKSEKVKVDKKPISKSVSAGDHEQALRNKIAEFLLKNKKQVTSDKIAQKIGEDKELVKDELLLMVNEKLANGTYVSGFAENVYGSTETTEDAIQDIPEEAVVEDIPQKETVSEKAADKGESSAPSKTKTLSQEEKDGMLLLIKDDTVNGGKGKAAIVNYLYGILKGSGVSRHDLEELVLEFIESGDLVEYSRDGRGIKFIAADVDVATDQTQEEITEEPAKEEIELEKKASVQVKTDTKEPIVGDFDINKLIKQLGDSISKELNGLPSDMAESLSVIGEQVNALQNENQKWRVLVKDFVNGVKKEFN